MRVTDNSEKMNMKRLLTRSSRDEVLKQRVPTEMSSKIKTASFSIVLLHFNCV